MSEKAYPIVAVAENATTTQSRPEPLNMAKARAALEYVQEMLYVDCNGEVHICANEVKRISDKIKDALAAPPRNCDKYATVEEAKKRFEVAYKDKVGFINFYKDTFAWLYADADESEAAK